MEALMFDLKKQVGFRDSYRHLLKGVRLQIVYHKDVDDISNQSRRLGAVTMRVKVCWTSFSFSRKIEDICSLRSNQSSEHFAFRSKYVDPS